MGRGELAPPGREVVVLHALHGHPASAEAHQPHWSVFCAARWWLQEGVGGRDEVGRRLVSEAVVARVSHATGAG
eukprot:7206632-Lingulodinium_polyedra.AAC.1